MRRYGVPAGMIEVATARRLAGDWRGACAAANIAVDLPADAERRADVAEDLRHLVPDLLRWHLPATAEPLNATGAVTVLSRYADGTGLSVLGPDATTQPQRLRLRLGPVDATSIWQSLHLSRERWDDRHTAELLTRCGGLTRTPFFTADGTPLPADRLGGDDDAGRTERVVRLLDADRAMDAWAEAGFDVDGPEYLLRHPRPGLTMLAERARHLARLTGADVVLAHLPSYLIGLLLDRLDSPRPRVRIVATHSGPPAGVPELPHAAHHWPPIFEQLRAGDRDPAQLHPLVGAALFPARATPTGPAAPALPAPVVIRCGAEWHEVAVADGGLRVPHPPEELSRERTLHALAGRPMPGCVAAVHGWRTRGASLPGEVLHLRRGLLRYVMHGEAHTLEALLDQGLDPATMDAQGRTLLHLLPWLFPADARLRILDRLLAAGLDVTARDRDGRTPLDYAERRGASRSLIRALLAAGTGSSRDAVDRPGLQEGDVVHDRGVAQLGQGAGVGEEGHLVGEDGAGGLVQHEGVADAALLEVDGDAGAA